MKKFFAPVLIGAALFAAAPALAQGLGHTWIMRGQVIAVEPTGLVICIGKSDGAQPGQVLDVYRAKYHPHGTKSNLPNYTRVKVGSVTISEVIDDHFARAQITDGKLEKHDIVELRKN
ncbi:hypothetical protein [Sphingorhabdus lacus]|uniref:DUF5666 domain-containing protein n=1 Tax=Sphingorhabdus lacus TaxID=392610 RepID=A0A6I6L3B4_9SPHN|nr:hypothetical protein [Sphingorhabdus lacus]QGY80235.1 hypothetical protein EUU25_06165 [Sphingorhabdus lacus]